MIDVFSFLASYTTPRKYSYDFEQTEIWLDENVFPKMIDAAQCGESSLKFVVEIALINPSNIVEVFEKRGYDVEYWPVVVGHTRYPGTTQMNIKVSWEERRDKNESL